MLRSDFVSLMGLFSITDCQVGCLRVWTHTPEGTLSIEED